MTNTHTVYESYKQTDDAKCKDDDADVPEKTLLSADWVKVSYNSPDDGGISELEDDNKSYANEDEREVGENHQAANSLQ